MRVIKWLSSIRVMEKKTKLWKYCSGGNPLLTAFLIMLQDAMDKLYLLREELNAWLSRDNLSVKWPVLLFHCPPTHPISLVVE
jgi:hypothetical protein